MTFTFVDLFAGIGGFHAALEGLGGKCVYAVELDEKASTVYHRNWGMNPLGDITSDVSDKVVKVPKHDVLVAGFPCQPFSKSGAQRGMEETRGTLYWNILRVIEKCKPSLVILENVRNLAGPRHSHEWQIIIETLRAKGYLVADEPGIFSPHLLPPNLGGRPQVRERVFIVAVRATPRIKIDQGLLLPVVRNQPVNGWEPSTWDIECDLPLEDNSKVVGCELSQSEEFWLDAWDDFVISLRKERKGRRLPGFPLWGDEWKPIRTLRIPPNTPTWKADYLRKNAQFYTDHRKAIDAWTSRWNFYSDNFPPSRRKLEWQAQDAKSLWDTVIHLRPSGIRAKRPTYLPALVAITQTSIIGKRRRRLSVREAARLQGLPDWFDFGPQPNSASYRQLGNGVCIGVIWHVVKQAVQSFEEVLKITCPNLVLSVHEAPDSPDKRISKQARKQKFR